MSLKKVTFLIVLVLFIDQVSKIYIKTHYTLGEYTEVFSWFKILFVENEGAAWGTKISDILPFVPEKTGKLLLSLFRLVAVAGIGYWLFSSVKKKAPNVLILTQALIFGGALGNIIDSVFYGIIFNDSYNQVATMFSEAPYGGIFYGKVVDMLYFPLIDTIWPNWVPIVGGSSFRFFQPVFNIADSTIFIGVSILLVFNKKAFPKE